MPIEPEEPLETTYNPEDGVFYIDGEIIDDVEAFDPDEETEDPFGALGTW